MRAGILGLGLVALAGCGLAPATPVAVDVSRTAIEVRMSDGSLCLGPAPASAGDTGWSGQLSGCPWAYGYDVAIDPGTNPVRFFLEEVLTGLGFDEPFDPIAEVTITRDQGQSYRFVSPPPVEED